MVLFIHFPRMICIIITGLIRTFFNAGLESFKEMINICLNKYVKIHIIMIISGEYDTSLINSFILQMNAFHISVEYYDFNINEANDLNGAKKLNVNYLKFKERYLNENNNAKNEINNPDDFIQTGIYQFYQLKQGIEKMIQYEQTNNIVFNVGMRTRFDVKYPIGFYPRMHANDATLSEKIFLNKENEAYFHSIRPEVEDLNRMIDEYIIFLKQQRIILPEIRTPHSNYSFGGSYLNNYVSLENIKNGSNDILYMYNDHFIFGKRDLFIILKDFFYEYGTIDTPLNINHFFAQEAQLLIFCFHKHINPIMFLHPCYHIIRS